jgi:hypothetical protein
MWRWRTAIGIASLVQIAIGLVLYRLAGGDERGRLALAMSGLAGGLAGVALVAARVRSWAAGFNGLLFFACLLPLAAGLLDGFAPPQAGSPLGEWLYPAVGAFAAACACNAVGLGRIAAREPGPTEPSVAGDRRGT